MRFFKFRRDANLSYYIQADKIELMESPDDRTVNVYGSFTNDDLAMDRVVVATVAGKSQETLDALAQYVAEERGTPIVTVNSVLFPHIGGVSLDEQ